MSATKLATILGALLKLESSYAAGGSLSPTTDGVLLAELADLNEDFAFDGSRAAPPASSGTQRRVPPKGSNVATTLKIEPVGAGSAYSVSNLLREYVLMRIAGHDAVLTSTAGSEKIVFKPTPKGVAFASAAAGLYSRGSLWSLYAAYADFSWGFDGPKVPMSEYAIKALFQSVADAGVPDITYPFGTVDPTPAADISLSIGGVTDLVVKKIAFKANRSLGPRMNSNAGGHAGFSPGRRTPQVEITIEEPATTLYDARARRRSAVAEAIAFQVGTVQYNREKWAMPAAQLMDVKPGAEDETATLVCTYQLNPTASGLTDEYSRTFD